jgi:hypothetical protein
MYKYAMMLLMALCSSTVIADEIIDLNKYKLTPEKVEYKVTLYYSPISVPLNSNPDDTIDDPKKEIKLAEQNFILDLNTRKLVHIKDFGKNSSLGSYEIKNSSIVKLMVNEQDEVEDLKLISVMINILPFNSNEDKRSMLLNYAQLSFTEKCSKPFKSVTEINADYYKDCAGFEFTQKFKLETNKNSKRLKTKNLRVDVQVSPYIKTIK